MAAGGEGVFRSHGTCRFRCNERADYGGGIDAAVARWGGREDWIDLSTGINPVPYPVGASPDAWTALPDKGAMAVAGGGAGVLDVLERLEITAAAGRRRRLPQFPDYGRRAGLQYRRTHHNEHEAAFRAAG